MSGTGSSNLATEVRLFFSSSNQLAFASKMSSEIKSIRERLDAIAKDHQELGLSPVGNSGDRMVQRVKLREETHSFVHTEDIIGRDDDKKVMLDMLLNSSVVDDHDVYFVTIVGIGGLGKTALAQLVYNDERITREFPLRFWVCVSDVFDIKMVFGKLLESATQQKHNIGDHSVELLQGLIREAISGKRYFLVLDDVWNEKREKWLELWNLLRIGGKGSRVVVTTRSKEVARIIGGGLHELKGLSPEKSWDLFEKMAFEKGEQKDAELLGIGKEIIDKCANVPLAIRVVGSLLYRQSKRIWLSFKEKGLADIREEQDSIMPIMKVSYYHLQHHLKSCFSYCALFPKDYEIEKETLISLWMANGFILPAQGQSFEDAGEEYFMALLQRCFFQDVSVNEDGEIMTCKMHDLIHDLAKEVASTNITMLVNNTRSSFNGKTRHLSIENEYDVRGITSVLAETQFLRTLLILSGQRLIYQSRISDMLLEVRYLRVLSLSGSSIKSLPSTIDKFLHLRYIDLSNCKDLATLPASLAKLHNLQTLKLKWCDRLKELPRGLSKLLNLRHLDINYCTKLSHMPPGMKNLTCLQKLPIFVLGVDGPGFGFSSKCPPLGQLEDLKALVDLRGKIEIKVGKDTALDTADVNDAGYVGSNGHLTEMNIMWLNENHPDAAALAAAATALLEGLRPHPSLRSFRLVHYPGVRFPNWTLSEDLAISLPNLVELEIEGCCRLQNIPLLGQLRNLKKLRLYHLENLEYIGSENSCSTCYDGPLSSLFPSLEQIVLHYMPRFEGWRRPTKSPSSSLLVPYLFPRLHFLLIRQCPNLKSIPVPVNLTSLFLRRLERDFYESSSFFVSFEPDGVTGSPELCLASDVESLSVMEEMFCVGLSSLEQLRIADFPRLKSLCGGGLEHLTNLTHLDLHSFDDLEQVEDTDHMPWKSLHHKLKSLKLTNLPKLVNLPQGIQYLTALESLAIEWCRSLESLPECISCLTRLTSLKIIECCRLKSLPEAIHNLNSLSKLEILQCPLLKVELRAPYSFPNLNYLEIEDCPGLIFIPLLTDVTSLSLLGSTEPLFASPSHFLLSCSFFNTEVSYLKLSNNLESLSVLEMFRIETPSSLEELHIKRFPKLKSLCGGGLEHLTSLTDLKLYHLDALEEFEDADHMPWKSLNEKLIRLKLKNLPKLVNLPQGIQYLTTLQSLDINKCHSLKTLPECIIWLTSLSSLRIIDCHRMKSLPEAIRNLTSLSKLEIWQCPSLIERCQPTTGEDWPKIQHIPNKSIQHDQADPIDLMASVAYWG